MALNPASVPSGTPADAAHSISSASRAFLDTLTSQASEQDQVQYIEQLLLDWIYRLHDRDPGKRSLAKVLTAIRTSDTAEDDPEPDINTSHSETLTQNQVATDGTQSESPNTSSNPGLSVVTHVPEIPVNSSSTCSAPTTSAAPTSTFAVSETAIGAQTSTASERPLTLSTSAQDTREDSERTNLRRSDRIVQKENSINADSTTGQSGKRKAQSQAEARPPAKKKPKGRPPKVAIETLYIPYKLAPDDADPSSLDEVLCLIKRQIESDELSKSTFDEAIEVVRELHVPETFRQLSRSFTRLLSETPDRDPTHRDKILHNCPRPFYDFVFIYKKILSKRCAQSDNFGITEIFDDLLLLDSWNNLKYTYQSEDATGHDWLVDQVKRLKHQNRAAAGTRDVTHLKALIGAYLGLNLNEEGANPVEGSEMSQKSGVTKKRPMASVQFDTHVRRARCIKVAIDHFGYGILPLIKPWRLHHVPIKTLDSIFTTLLERRPSIKTLCDTLDKVYVTPIKRDSSIDPTACESFLSVSSFAKFTGTISELFTINQDASASAPDTDLHAP